ncbi:response regulator [Vibrio hepatarius]|uniref:response regulator n=1 Tax=Vibrio hepatarius TaxID=171383 RepID=UPI00142D6B98|nr:response regulator [Vibrio hepatarius]
MAKKTAIEYTYQEKQEKVVVIDDSKTLCNTFCELLADLGFRTEGYYSGNTALEAMQKDIPDLLLLDLNMPDVDGYEVCRRMQSNKALADIPIVVISSYSNIDEKLKAFEAGAVDYVTKPIQMAEVQARIETHLSLRRYQRALEEKNTQLTQTLDELKDAQRQLIQTAKLASIGKLVAGVAHEINNPVSFIIGNAHIIQRDLTKLIQSSATNVGERTNIEGTLSELVPAVDDILEASHRINNIVKDLQSFSAKGATDKSTVNFSTLVKKAVNWTRKSNQPAAEILLVLPSYLPVLGDEGQLTQVILNLLANALDASKDEDTPTITMQGERCGENVVLRIKDNGTGVEAHHLEHLFDPFFTTKKVGEGTGLGLSISYGLVTEHNGSLAVENNPDKGACFTLTLPWHE